MDILDFLERNSPENWLSNAGDGISTFYSLHIHEYIVDSLPLAKFVAQIFSVVFVAGLFYVVLKTRELNSKEYKMYQPIDVEQVRETRQETQWGIIERHRDSGNASEWKLAIIEADNMLDDILKTAGYKGSTLGDRLKVASESNQELFSPVWEAHKVRNRIAHEAGVDISSRETQKTLSIYETFFKNFGVEL